MHPLTLGPAWGLLPSRWCLCSALLGKKVTDCRCGEWPASCVGLGSNARSE